MSVNFCEAESLISKDACIYLNDFLIGKLTRKNNRAFIATMFFLVLKEIH